MKTELAQVWAYRARREREATLRFARIALELDALSEDARWGSAFRDASSDESRHEALCAEFASRGGVAVAPGAESHASVAPPGLRRWQALLYDIVATCCVAETVNAALLTAELHATSQADLRALTRQLLRDEVQHARLGWMYLGDVARRRDAGFLSPHLGALLGIGSVEEAIVAPQVLAAGRSQRILRETLLDVVLPGLEAHGLPSPSRLSRSLACR